jgi:4-amino-4-deoxychorismate lyase
MSEHTADGLTPMAMVDGVRVPLADAVLPLTDPAAIRGDGVFETIGVWGGHPFALEAHLARLRASLDAAGLGHVEDGPVRDEVEALLTDVTADAALRIVRSASGLRILLLDHQPRRPPLRRLALAAAPWIAPDSPLSGVKSLSYQANMTALRAAQRAGADDALLHTADGVVLEGTTFGVCWVVGGRLEAPAVALGILDSISRRTVLELAREEGLEVGEGRFDLRRLEQASEVLAVSSLRPLTAVAQVGGVDLSGAPTPVHDRLGPLLEERRRGQ